MSERTLPILLWILHAEDHELKHIPLVSRLDIMDGATLNFHPEGLFSTEIFGAAGSELRDQLFGKIDLKVRIIHPKIFNDLMSLKELYKRIVDGSAYCKFVKGLGDFVLSDAPDAETGYGFFVKHLPDLKLKVTKSIARTEKVRAFEKWKHRLTMKNLVVLPAGLRDAEIGSDGRVSKNEINDFYTRILAASSVVVKSDDMDGSEYDGIRRSLQLMVNELYAYIDGLIGGKRGFGRDKFMSRRVMDGTRNVITAMDASGSNLDSPNVPGFDSTVLGLYQTTRGLAPAMVFNLRQGPLSKLVTASDDTVQLINPKTLMREWVSVDPSVIETTISEQGIMELINELEDVEARSRPVMIENYYLALVYTDKESFKVFDSIDELPDILAKLVKQGEARVAPITLAELIYYAGYQYFPTKYILATRYPTTDDNSIYPTRIYVKTTTTAKALRERDLDWNYYEGDSNLAPEWPRHDVKTYHDSHAPHSGRLGWSAAD